MANPVLIQIWHDEKLWAEDEFTPEGQGGYGISGVLVTIQDALMALEPGESFTLSANRL